MQTNNAAILKIRGYPWTRGLPVAFSRYRFIDRVASGSLTCSGHREQATPKSSVTLAAFEPVSRKARTGAMQLRPPSWLLAESAPNNRASPRHYLGGDVTARYQDRSEINLCTHSLRHRGERVRHATGPCMVPEVSLRRISETGGSSGTTESSPDWPRSENVSRRIFFSLPDTLLVITQWLLDTHSPVRPTPAYILRCVMWAS